MSALYRPFKAISTIYSLLLCLVFLCLAFPKTASAATYYVSGNGTGSTCTSSAPCSLTTANGKLTPGDTAKLLPGTYNQPIKPASSGSSGAYITYQATDNTNLPLITSVDTGIDLTGKSYINVNYVKVDGQSAYPNNKINVWAYITGHHNTISNSVFKNAKGYVCFKLDNGAHHNKIINNTLDTCGTDNDPSKAPMTDVGNSLNVECTAYSNLIEGNILRRGGHSLFANRGYSNILRNNYFENEWVAGNPSYPYDGQGNRCGVLSFECTNFPLAERLKYSNLFEDNVCTKSLPASDQPVRTSAIKVEGIRHIVRRNFFFNNHNIAIHTAVRGTPSKPEIPYSINNMIYHNVFYNNGGPSWEIRIDGDSSNVNNNNVFKNNIAYKNRQRFPPASGFASLPAEYDNDLLLKDLDDRGISSLTYLGNRVIGNSVYKKALNDGMVQVNNIGRNSLSWYESNQSKYFSQNLGKAPSFTNENPQNPQKQDFHLKSTSELIDAGTHLTKTISNGSGSVVPVEDAGYFFDGYDITQGDMIKVGANPGVRISSINYLTNTLTLASSISWSNNDPVDLCFDGVCFSGSAPDIGAYEYGGVVPTGNPTATPTTPPGKPTTKPTTRPPLGHKSADVSRDGEINAKNLIMIMAVWGPIDRYRQEDINSDGRANSLDAAVVLAAW